MDLQLISISGVDGSGKSTQVGLLKKYLESRGHKVMYFHAVYFSVANSFSRKKNHSDVRLKKDSGESVITASWSAIQLRKIALLIDLLRFEFAQKKWQRSGYTHIVSDRYFYDNIINILYLSHDKKLYSFGTQLLARLITPPTHAFFLDVAPTLIMQRDRAPEQGVEYLSEKRRLFRKMLDAWRLITLNGDQEHDVIFSHIRKKIAK